MLAPASSPGWAAALRRCLIGIQRPAGAGRWRLARPHPLARRRWRDVPATTR